MLGEEDGNDTDDTGRSGDNTESFGSPHRKKNVGHWWRRFCLWSLRICYV